jgi:hypothetical protein
MTLQPKQRHRRQRVMCLETNVVYESALKAAKAVKRTRCAMANHLDGRSPTLAGKHFVRLPDVAEVI